jgi:hypothetical protein
VHAQVAAKACEVIAASDEVGFTSNLNHHTDTLVVVDVGVHATFGGCAISLLVCSLQTLLTQKLLRLLGITTGFHQCLFAVHHASTGCGAERGHFFR